MNAHLLVFDTTQVDRVLVRDKLDGFASVENWTSFFGNVMCLASKEDAQALSRRVRDAFPKVRFVIVTIDPAHKGGFLPRELWQFMNDPTPVAEISGA